jgi:hypothetical protein
LEYYQTLRWRKRSENGAEKMMFENKTGQRFGVAG